MTHPDTPELAVELFEAIKSSKASAVAVDVNELLPKLERLLAKRELEGRIDEMETPLNDMNIGDEFLTKPTQKNKGWNKVILARLAELREELATYE